ncbi:hypothetical protein KC19_1G038200 [Ceratodon purpureus]|uniref:Uncharacterized protein n=1 Tax=Ceratodon purpureus TaxID=3225 RepID=A0A8T0J297_CERPU|nr:hypothetical protein KC19_1G038200 [Ceratodon purpureus]
MFRSSSNEVQEIPSLSILEHEHTEDAWQSDGQGNQIHNCAESYGQHNIYPPGTYVANNACQNQPAGYYNVNSTPGTQQDTWHTEVHGTGLYNATAYPEQGSHLPNAIVSSEGCTHGPSYSNFTYQTAYQQEPWHTTYANADGTHHIQGAPEQTSYCAGGVAGANVGQTAGYPNNDHPYLDPVEQQRQIEHAQYLISRWGASDETPADPSPISGAQPFPTPYPSTHASQYQVDQHWSPGNTLTEGVQNTWGFGPRGVIPQQCTWPYVPAQRLTATSLGTRNPVREHGSQTPTLAPATIQADQNGRRSAAAPQWTPKEFQPEEEQIKSNIELSPPATAAAAAIPTKEEEEKNEKVEVVAQEDDPCEQITVITQVSNEAIEMNVEFEKNKISSFEDNSQYQSTIEELDQVGDKSNDLQILQLGEPTYKSNTQQKNIYSEDKYTSNFIVEDVFNKKYTNDKNLFKLSNPEVDIFENNVENSTTCFESSSLLIDEKTKSDDLQMNFKDHIVYKHGVSNKHALNHLTKNIQDVREEQKNLKLYGEFLDKVHVRMKLIISHN